MEKVVRDLIKFVLWVRMVTEACSTKAIGAKHMAIVGGNLDILH